MGLPVVFERSCHNSSSYHFKPSSMIFAISLDTRARGVRSGFCCFRFDGGVGVMIRILSISLSSSSKSDASFSSYKSKFNDVVRRRLLVRFVCLTGSSSSNLNSNSSRLSCFIGSSSGTT